MNFLICFSMIGLHHIIAIWTWKPLNILARSTKPPYNCNLPPKKQRRHHVKSLQTTLFILCKGVHDGSKSKETIKKLHIRVYDTESVYNECTDLLLTIQYDIYKTFILLFSYIPIFRGLCPQGVLSAGVLFRGLCPQGVLSAGGFVLDSHYWHYCNLKMSLRYDRHLCSADKFAVVLQKWKTSFINE